jgi:hypothetical protein
MSSHASFNLWPTPARTPVACPWIDDRHDALKLTGTRWHRGKATPRYAQAGDFRLRAAPVIASVMRRFLFPLAIVLACTNDEAKEATLAEHPPAEQAKAETRDAAEEPAEQPKQDLGPIP